MTTAASSCEKPVIPYLNAGYCEPPKNEIEGFKKLMISIRNGETGLLNKYIEDNGDVNLRLLWYANEFCPEITLLMIACQHDHYIILEKLISVRADIHAQDEYGRTALHYAANNGSVKNCDILIKNGAFINQPACKICYRLLGPNTSILSGSKETALHEACNRGFLDVVKFLIANGADINAKNKYDETPIEKCESKWFDPNKEELEVKSYLEDYIKKRNISAIIIQNALCKARYNPAYKMCQKIQKKSLENEIRKIYNDLKS